ncbi:competence protein ComA [Thermoplasmatales archaeon SG8-52-1]|nr:MAG: competence protein ComA [Thermoplasmatales archaeon SG8-52-1]
MIDENNLKIISDLLKKNHITIATAESCTGGLIAHTLTNISGSSEYFDRGFITYSNNAKIESLDVSKKLLEKHGAVSKEVAEAMANGVRTKSNVDIGISTTGIAGPTGGTIEKPVGLVYIAISRTEKTIVKKFQFSGDRLQNKENTCKEALQMLYDLIIKL